MRSPSAHPGQLALVASVGAALAAALGAGACGTAAPAMPATCVTTTEAGYERALAAVPAPVRLPGGTRISSCVRFVRDDGDLQTLGLVVHALAERLATQVRAHDGSSVAAAQRLGYLSAAVAAGAARSNGISSELARRVATAGTGLDDLSAAVAHALAEGQAAGRRTG